MAKKSSKTPRRTSPSKTHGVINGAGEVGTANRFHYQRELYAVCNERNSLPCNSRN